MYYLQIDKQLTWSQFKNVTREVRNNLDFSNFDAALVALYTMNRVLDLVRIYAKDIDQSRLEIIHKKYTEIIAKKDLA